MTKTAKRPELPKWAKVPFVALGLILAAVQPYVFATGCIGYLIAEEYIWVDEPGA